MTELELTPFGKFINQFSVWNEITYWRRLVKEVEACADKGGDWEAMIAERIAGLQYFANRRIEQGEVRNWND